MKGVFYYLILGLLLSLAARAQSLESIDDLRTLESKVTEVSKLALPATVALVSEKSGSSGSGVIVSEEGLILTAAHVIQGMEEVNIYFADGRKWSATVLGANLSKDIGMVKMKEKGPWPFVKIGESKSLSAGDWVVALGHSTGYDAARTPPVRFGRVMSDGPGNYFTSDATLIGGDSGGPIFDLEGQLVGINSSIGWSWKNNNHAGIDGFKVDWEKLLAGETWGVLQMNPMANPETPVIGVDLSLNRGKGVQIRGVRPGAPAARAGLRRGDILLSVDGVKIKDNRSLQSAIYKKEPGESVKFEVKRHGEMLSLEVVVGKLGDVYRIEK